MEQMESSLLDYNPISIYEETIYSTIAPME
jgi:hypothetical protein